MTKSEIREKFRFCACIDNSWFDTMLATYRYFDNPDKNWDKFVAEEFGGKEGPAWIIISGLDVGGQVDHGINLRLGWLTEKGKKFLKVMEEAT